MNAKKICTLMGQRIAEILWDNPPSLYLSGSCVLEDFRPGWSDIDILVLTKEEISGEAAQKLLMLRQSMQGETGEAAFRSLEGAMLSAQALRQGYPTRVVYWGTSGQRISDHYALDSFSRWLLLKKGELLLGEDRRMGFCLPTHEEFLGDIRHHYETIRNYAQKTGGNLYAFGWMLDIARCLYTLQRDEVISKTQAGEWALREGLCPEKAVMEEVLRIRGDPEAAVRDADTMFWAKEMGPHVQKFADVLEAYLAEE